MNCKRKPIEEGTKFKMFVYRYTFEHEISITNLAKEIGIPTNSFNHYVNGGLPNVITGIKIARYFGKKVEDLW